MGLEWNWPAIEFKVYYNLFVTLDSWYHLCKPQLTLLLKGAKIIPAHRGFVTTKQDNGSKWFSIVPGTQ